MKRFSLILIVVLILCTATSCAKKTETMDVVEATVIDTEYHEGYTTVIPIWNGKFFMFVPVENPEEYLVTIVYEDVSQTFDDSDLYHRVKEGDTIQMELYICYLDDEIVEKKLQFPE